MALGSQIRSVGIWFHQAIEAKEGEGIIEETQTLVTITYQN